MKEITVASWDDLHYASGERVPADPASAVTLSLGSKTVELDLTAEHRKELEELLAPWLKAGAAQKQPRLGAKPRTEGMSQMGASRRYNKAMVEWAARSGREYNITYSSDAHKPYYPEDLRRDYAAYLASQGAGDSAR